MEADAFSRRIYLENLLPRRRHLKRLIAQRKVIAIVGAGVSRNATTNSPVSDWKGLLLDGVSRVLVNATPKPALRWKEHVEWLINEGDIRICSPSQVNWNVD